MTFLVRLDEAGAGDASIGGKARSLLRLAAAGLPVPPALVVTAELFLSWEPAAPFPPGFEAALAAGLAELAAGAGGETFAVGTFAVRTFAVRSSAALEDRPGALGAGLFLSRVGVPAAEVPGAVRAVLASALSPGAAAYAARAGLGAEALEMAVLIHPFLEGDAAGTAALDPGAGAEAGATPTPLVEVRGGRAAALGARARAEIEDAVRALAAAHGAVEVEWVSAGDQVRFVQLRPYRASVRARWRGDAELDALPGGPWRWDASHNPLPLSPAQAGLVAFADDRCRTAFRQRVVGGYLFFAPAPAPAPATASAASAGAALRALARDAEARLAQPAATLEAALETFAAVYEPLYGVVQPAAAAARAALAELVPTHAGGRATLGALLAGVPSAATERTARARAIASAAGPAARAAAVAAYLERFGDEAPVWDVAVPTYAEDPSVLEGLAARAERATQTTIDNAQAPLPAATPTHAEWNARLAAAREAAAVAEDDDALYARVQAAVRRALLREGERLRARGAIAHADDVFWLPLDDVRRDARGEGPLDAGAAGAVAEARRAHAEAGADPPPLGAAPEDGDGGAGGLARGRGAAPGRAVGRARIHAPGAPAPPPSPDDVVIARTLLPTELPLIAAAALVVETGGVLDHVAAQARERGIPAVVGAAGACAAFRDGDRVLVDGDAGLAIKLPG